VDKADVVPVPDVAACEWRCVFQPRTSTLEWVGNDARQRFPITVEANENTPDELEMRYESSDNRLPAGERLREGTRERSSDPWRRVRFMPENGNDSTITTDAKGYYEMKLTFEQPFRVKVFRDDKVSKIVEMDPRTVPQKERKQGFVVWTDITLFDPVPGADFFLPR
jgi:hypothetical protein